MRRRGRVHAQCSTAAETSAPAAASMHAGCVQTFSACRMAVRDGWAQRAGGGKGPCSSGSLPPTHTHHHARAHAVHAEGAHSQADTWLHSPEEVLECGLGTVLNFFADCRMLSTNQFLATQIFCR